MKKINQNGITLTALIITIIVLLILAGIVINLSIGQKGIIQKAQNAGEKYEEAEANEINDIEMLGDEIDSSINPEESIEPIKMFIDTSRRIACVGKSPDWCTTSYTYTATEDCAILGRVGTNNGQMGVILNDVDIGFYRSSANLDYSAVYYLIKKGDTIQFKNIEGKTYISIYAYGLK